MLATFKHQLQSQLEQFTDTKVSDRVLQLKLKALILDLIHHIAVVDEIISSQNRLPYVTLYASVNLIFSTATYWTWHKQLRFYFANGSVIARQSDAEFAYTYEYQGNAAKLVHTPLTDKCYLTLTQGL